MSALILYAAAGMLAGLLAGLFGVGGGLIIVPALILVFESQDLAPEILVHLAVGTSLATIVLTSLSSIYAHHRHDAVLWPVFARLAPGIVLGAGLGAALADALPAAILRGFFGVFELLVAAQLALNSRPEAQRTLPGWTGMSIAGGLIGGVSALVGIGGGTMTVPFLLWCRVAAPQAVATSAASGLPLALSGVLGFIVSGWQAPGLPEHSSGFVYWPAFLGIVSFSVLFAPLGAVLAHRLPAAHLKRFFAGFLALLGIKMLLF